MKVSRSTLRAADFNENITQTFHLINSLRLASSRLVTEVAKVVDAGADDRVLEALYDMPAYVTGQNIRMFVALNPNEQEQRLSTLWLFSIVGAYEVWAESFPGVDGKRGCQFPTRGHSGLSRSSGYADAFGELDPSVCMRSLYADKVCSNDLYLGSDIDDALLLYRFFKEARNALAHSGGLATGWLSQWRNEAFERAGYLYVDQDGSPSELPVVVEGRTIMLTIQEVRRFVMVLFRIAYTVDANFLLTIEGEREVVERWQAVHGFASKRGNKRTFASGSWWRNNLQEAEIPLPEKPADFKKFAVERGLAKESLFG